MMKKLLTAALSLVLLTGFACGGCDGGGEEDTGDVTVVYDSTVTETGEGFLVSNGKVSAEIGSDGVVKSVKTGDHTILSNTEIRGQIAYSTATKMYDAKSFSAKEIESASASKIDKGVKLVSKFNGASVTVETLVRTSGNEVYFENKVINKAKGVVASVNVPAFDSLSEIPDGILYFPNRNGGILRDPLGSNRGADPLQMRYPLPLGAQFLTYGSDALTVSLRSADTKMGYKEFYFGGTDNELNVNVYCFTEPGETASIAPTVVFAAEGNWMDASVSYQNWFDAWAKKPVRSARLDDFPVVSEVRANWKPLESENVAPEGLDSIRNKILMQNKSGYEGTELVTWWGGPDSPNIGPGIPNWQDLNYPDYAYPSTIGDRDGLAAFLESVQISGMQLGFYTNARLISDTTSFGMANVNKWKVKPANNAPLDPSEDWWLTHYYVACPGADGYFDAYYSRLEEFSNAGLDFAQLDQIGAADSFLCFDSEHSHSAPQYAWSEGYTKFLKKVEKLTEKNGTWFWTEGTWEGACQYVQLSQKGNWGMMNQDVSNMEDFPELFMFTFPSYKLSASSAWYGGVPMWQIDPKSDEVAIQKANAEFYRGSSFRNDFGLVYDRTKCDAVWHRNGNRVMLLVKGSDGASETVTVSIPKGFVGDRSLGDFTAQGSLSNVSVTENGENIVLSVKLSANGMGGALIALK